MAKVLNVDDNRAFAENLAEILEDAGHTPDITESGAAALRKIAATRYDVMLSDMRMPEMGGAELIHRMRRQDPGLPAIVITAYTYEVGFQAVTVAVETLAMGAVELRGTAG